MALNEADTCRKFVVPKLQAAGWDTEPHSINEQVTFTDGRIIVAGRKARRRPGRRADYILRYRPDMPVAVAEAKPEYKTAAEGLQQAKAYAEILGLSFAYSTNGLGIVEHDFTTGVEREIDAFPTPDELWRRLCGKEKLSAEQAERVLTPAYHLTGKSPRYYQTIAINRVVQAILQGIRLARLMLGDLKTVAARLQTAHQPASDKFMLVAVDEFASFAFEEFAELINKARSARIALLLAHQSMRGDLQKAGEFFFRQIQSNTNIKICLRQDSPEDAEEIAKSAGTYTTVKRTEQVEMSLFATGRTGMGTDREVEAYVVHPNLIKSLPTGQAVVVCSDPRRIEVVQLDFPRPLAPVGLRLPKRDLPAAAPRAACVCGSTGSRRRLG